MQFFLNDLCFETSKKQHNLYFHYFFNVKDTIFVIVGDVTTISIIQKQIT